MTTTQAQQLDRCARALRAAERALACNEPLRTSALMNAQDEIHATIAILRWRPRSRPSPAVMAVFTVCVGLFVVVSVETARLLTAGRPAVEVRR